MIDIWVNRREGAMSLLFWRSFSDLGVAIRFISSYGLNQLSCGKYECSLPAGNIFLKFIQLMRRENGRI